MMHSPSHLIFYIYSVRVCLLFLRDVSNIIFSLGVKVFAFSPGGTILQDSLTFSVYCR